MLQLDESCRESNPHLMISWQEETHFIIKQFMEMGYVICLLARVFWDNKIVFIAYCCDLANVSNLVNKKFFMEASK